MKLFKMKKVIFLCGMDGSKKDMSTLKKILKNYEILYFPYDTSLRNSFEELAQEFDSFIKNLKLKKEKVYALGFSAGGIVLDYYLKFYKNNKIEKAAIVCSPIKGTYIAKFFPKEIKGVHQVYYNSNFIKKLNSKKIQNTKIISFWSFFDPMMPGLSSKYENSNHTFFCLHWFVQFWPPIFKKIKKFFDF